MCGLCNGRTAGVPQLPVTRAQKAPRQTSKHDLQWQFLMSEVPLYPGLVNVGWLVAGLLEFRYFIIQAMLALIHQPLPHWDASNGSNATNGSNAKPMAPTCSLNPQPSTLNPLP